MQELKRWIGGFRVKKDKWIRDSHSYVNSFQSTYNQYPISKYIQTLAIISDLPFHYTAVTPLQMLV